MTDQRPRGSCVIPDCPRDPWRREDGTTPLVCGPHLSQVRCWLVDIPRHTAELGRQLVDASMPDPNGKDISVWLPSAPVSAPRTGGRVSGSPEARLPFNVDEVDLLGPRRPLRAEQGGGYDSVWSVLSFWCVDLAEHRDAGERGQRPRDASPIPWLADWLLERVDEAADDWPLFAAFFTDLKRLHAALRALLGIVDVPDYKKGTPCPKCSMLTLVHQYGTERVECTACGCLLKIDEYEEYVMTLATALSTEERERRRKAAADRRALVRLLREMRAVGWRHSTRWQDETDPETGAPEGYRVHQWGRGDELIEVQIVDDEWYSAVSYSPDPDALYGAGIIIGVGWVRANGLKRLHAVTSAAGVLSVPKERAA